MNANYCTIFALHRLKPAKSSVERFIYLISLFALATL
jgi:hypothetical protein